MKIMHITEAMGGGVQNAISKYTQLLTSSDHTVVGRPREGEASGEFSEETRVLEFRGGLLPYLRHVRTLVQLERPDIVHLHSSLAGLSRLLLPRTVAIAYSPHCYAFERRDKNTVWRSTLWLIEWVLARRKQALIAVSPHEARLGRRLNSKMPVHYVPNVLTSDSMGHSKPAAQSVCMVGRIGAQKDPSLFAAVSRELGPDFRFCWVGDGETDLKTELINSGVTVTGWVTPAEARRLVSQSALYLHTGAWEAAPISAMEAAAAGVPVIARRIATMDSLGYLTVPESTLGMAAEVRRFFHDKAFQESVSRQTSLVIDGLSPSLACGALSEAYEITSSLLSFRPTLREEKS
ncbi:glycosyltransferase [Arthrobacter sp. UYCo732]|uniref:glycosyltransferase n=1 Tax=Arthrobacter sp. UYCo732 TaxID=3156336 RepID=UPI003396999C